MLLEATALLLLLSPRDFPPVSASRVSTKAFVFLSNGFNFKFVGKNVLYVLFYFIVMYTYHVMCTCTISSEAKGTYVVVQAVVTVGSPELILSVC